MNKELEDLGELRCMGYCPYNIHPKQMGIQFGHAVVELGLMEPEHDIYLEWARYHKTFIVLDGGTTNNNPEKLGTINQLLNTIKQLDCVTIGEFYEPDLGDQLSSFVFIADEKLFDHKKYPTFDDYIKQKYNITNTHQSHEGGVDFKVQFSNEWIDYVEFHESEERVKLKEILKNSRLWG